MCKVNLSTVLLHSQTGLGDTSSRRVRRKTQVPSGILGDHPLNVSGRFVAVAALAMETWRWGRRHIRQAVQDAPYQAVRRPEAQLNVEMGDD